MYKILFLTFSLSILFLTAKPFEPCATEFPEEMTKWLKEHVKNNTNPVFRRSAEPYYIPVKVHIVGNDIGGGYYRTSNLLNAFCNLNQQFEETGFLFYIYEDINYINNTSLYEHTSFWGPHTFVIQNNIVSNVANMFFVNNPAGACGYYAGSIDFIAINNSCAGSGNSTIAHEFGHYFSLPHTFFGWEGGNTPGNPERVDGSNCATSADFFCDTPADYIATRWNCPYTGSLTDPTGTPINPDAANFMSYSFDACQEYFSNEQMHAMNTYLLNQRSNLLNHAPPSIDSLEKTTIIEPADGQTNLFPNFTQFRWNSVEGATHYHVLISRYINPNISNIDTVITDTTFIVTNLDPNINTYRWSVRPYNSAYTCTPPTDVSFFSTGNISVLQPEVTVNKPSCFDNTDGSIVLNINGGTPPYTYNWSNNSTGPTASNVSAGTYSVTISDVQGNDINFNVDVSQPQPVEIDFVQQGNQLNLSVSGGTPPYSYNWNTGSSDSFVGNIEPGFNYQVEVTDSRGCTGFNSTVISSLQETNKLENNIKIYPNPLFNNTDLTVKINSESSGELLVTVFDNLGRTIYNNMEFVQNGMQHIQIPFTKLSVSNGLYLIRFHKDGNEVTRKVQIL
ncbi:MAG: T9SS C-terminal target domain-containing protein [Chitinophagaceae bacterium]|nr:MAG: T9SS C-terminal target domain-containing protein [Chitinophagaceae bacterium]